MAQRIIDQSISLEDIELEEKKKKAEDKKAEKEAQDIEDSSGESKTKSKSSNKKKSHGAKYKEAKKKIDNTETHRVPDAIKLVRNAAYAEFTESIELHIVLGIDPKNSDQRIRFTTTLPHGVGKTVRVLVISTDNSGEKDGIVYRDTTVVDDIVKGKLTPGKDFDMVVATPDVMKDIAKAARVLGPKGMMPSPKNNTVTSDVEKAVADLAKGQVEIKSQSGHAIIQQIVGNLNFKDEQLIENVEFLLTELDKHNPAKMKQKLIQKVYLASSMGPSVRVVV